MGEIKGRIARNALVGFSPAFFGFSLNKAWAACSLPYFSDSILGFQLPTDTPLLSFDLLFAGFACIMAVGSLKLMPAKFRSAAFPTSTIACVLSSLLLFASRSFETASGGLTACALVLGAFGMVGMSALWVDFYSLFSPLRALFLNAGSIVLSIVIRYAIAESTYPRIFVLLLGMAVAASLCYQWSWRRSTGDRPRGNLGKAKATFPYKVAIFVACYSFAYGLASPYVAGLHGFTELRLLPALLVIALAFLNIKRFDIKLLYNIAFPTMVCGMLLVAVIPGVSPDLSFFMLDTSYAVLSMLLMAIACGISYSLGTSASWIFCFSVAIQFVAKTSGQIANGMLQETGVPLIHETMLVVSVIFIVIASIVMMSENSIFSHWGSRQTAEAAEDEGGVPFTQMRIDSLSDAYGLTQRETDVVRLLSEGKTVTGIANDMFIAPGTVKAHIQHIYQKTGVHSRKELFDLIGANTSKNNAKTD